MVWGGPPAVPLLPPLLLLVLPALLVGLGVATIRNGSTRGTMLVLLVASLSIPLSAYVGSVVGLTTFTNGTVADALDVNQNFTAVETAVNDNDARVTQLETLQFSFTEAIAVVPAGGSFDAIHGSNSEQVTVQIWTLQQGSIS